MNIQNEFDKQLEKLKENCKFHFDKAIYHLDEALRLAIESKGAIRYYDFENLYNELRSLQFTDDGWQKSMDYDC